MRRRKKRAKAQQKSKAAPEPLAKLSPKEEDLLWHMGHGYQLETSSLWDNPILRRLRDNIEVRATANRGTIEALEKNGLISVAKSGSVLKPTVWRLTPKASALELNGPH